MVKMRKIAGVRPDKMLVNGELVDVPSAGEFEVSEEAAEILKQIPSMFEVVEDSENMEDPDTDKDENSEDPDTDKDENPEDPSEDAPKEDDKQEDEDNASEVEKQEDEPADAPVAAPAKKPVTRRPAPKK